MYGKFFESTFTGSMFGAGAPVFAVWAYIIAYTYKDRVELNPKLLAPMIGCSVEEIETALEYLRKPDPDSRTKQHEGRRIVQEGQFQYFVPNHSTYRKLRDERDRREYNRDAKRKSRAKSQGKSIQMSTDVSHGQPRSAHTETETETETETKNTRGRQRRSAPLTADTEFPVFWEGYPRKVGKADALKIWLALSREDRDLALKAVIGFAEAWAGAPDRKFLPHPATWLNKGRWNDDPSEWWEQAWKDHPEELRRRKREAEKVAQRKLLESIHAGEAEP